MGTTGARNMDQRFYASTYGRFNTPDQYVATGGGPGDPDTPGSWNRYAYLIGDPVNFSDPSGTCGGPSISGTRSDGTMYVSVAIPCPPPPGGNPVLGMPYQPIAPGPEQQHQTVAEYDDLHPTPALERAQCLGAVSKDVASVKKSVDADIAEEFKPLPNILSLSGKEALYFAYRGAKGALGAELTTDATLGAIAGGAIGAVIGAAAAVITLPLNGPIGKLSTAIANGAIDISGKIAANNCNDPNGVPLMPLQ